MAFLVFGGTTEGRTLTQRLDAACLHHSYSTQRVTALKGSRYRRLRFGALGAKALSELCLEQRTKLIIDASHPFATGLHGVLAHTSHELELPLWRLERTFAARRAHPLVHYLSNYEDALAFLREQRCARLLALTGVNSIPKLESYWRTQTCFLRVLDRASSRAEVLKGGFPLEQTLFSGPAAHVKEEVACWRSLGVDAVLCKESGESGFLEVKIDAALELNLPILILRKPPLPLYKRTFTAIEPLIAELSARTWD